MTNGVKIISTEILSDKFFPLKYVKYEHQKKDGSRQQVNREVYVSGNGVTALLYNREKGTVILIKQFRLPAYLNKISSDILIEACAGLLEDNEDPADAMIREIEEETGYKVMRVKKLFGLYSTPGSVTEMLHYFIAEYNAEQKVGEGGGLEEENEEIEVIEMPFEEAYNQIATGKIRDAKTVTLLQYARINLFLGEKVFEIL